MHRLPLLRFSLAALALLASSFSPLLHPTATAALAAAGPTYYDIGTPTLSELYVSPSGSDDNTGASPAQPLRTLTAAWNRVPATLTATGYRLNLLPGTYPCEPGPDETANCVNYFSDRQGTFAAPLMILAQAGPGTVTLRGGLELNNVHYLYLMDLTMVGGSPAGTPWPTNNSGNNLLHLANADHVLLRGLTLTGPACLADTCNGLQEVIKVNQARYLYLEDSDVSGTFQTGLDYFSVQYGHILNSRLHGSGGRCAYLKGGSAYFQVEGNEFYDCREAGFQAGEGSDFSLMQSPYLHYEAYDIKIYNNLVHDIYGAGLSVAGGYNILMAYNTLYRVGLTNPDTGQSWTLAQFVQGNRGCGQLGTDPGSADGQAARRQCQAWAGAGGWGPTEIITGENPFTSIAVIPNRNVYVYNNLFYNPAPAQTEHSLFAVDGPATVAAPFQNILSPARTDDNLVFAGNLVWNGAGAGLDPFDTTNGTTPGCQPANPTCNATRLAADNLINTLEPQLDASRRPVAGSNLFSVTTPAIPNFAWGSFSPSVPAGTVVNAVNYDRAGMPRPAGGPPGAYAVPTRPTYLPLLWR